MKKVHVQEKVFENDLMSFQDKQNKFKAGREHLEQVIAEMKLTLPQNELAYGIQRALDEKHEAELNDILVDLFEQKCKELQEEVFNLLEEKLHKQAEIKKETQDKVEILDRALAKTQDEETKKKLEDAKEMVKT